MRLICCTLLLISISSCKSVDDLTGNTPIVDTKGVNMADYNRDLTECQAYADDVQTAQKAASSAVAGAAVGGAIGAIVGNSNTAARGAGIGAVGGGARGLGDGIRERDRVVKRCLSGRGYRVLN